ncbi:MAG TPA: hypothetical protein ENN67_02890, partial [Firmicutes bacterium]|nr:hypothetical protein [Bacillota bacterium]
GWIQIRLGPNRVGPWGILQPIADMFKLLIKEDIVPKAADKWLHLIAPIFIFVPTLLAFVVIPFSGGTLELPQDIVSPTFKSMWMEPIDAELAEEKGLPGPGWLEVGVNPEIQIKGRKIWWVHYELDHEPLFLPSDDRGYPADTRYRLATEKFALHQVKTADPTHDLQYAAYYLMMDYGTPARKYDIVRVQFLDNPGHRGAVEIGLETETIAKVQEQFSAMVAGIGPDIEDELRFDFGGVQPRIFIQDLFEQFSRSVAVNGRRMGPGSMIPVFYSPSGDPISWRSLNTIDYKHYFSIHGSVMRDEGRAGLYFFPGVFAREDRGKPIEEFNLDEIDWLEKGASFRIIHHPELGYLIQTVDGEEHILGGIDQPVNLKLGDSPISVSLKDRQYYNYYFIAKDLGIGILYLLAVTSLAVVGIFMAGFGANNKWSLYGAMRSAAQLISYEIPMTLAVIGPVLMAGSLSMTKLVEDQEQLWYVFPQFLAFFIFLVCMVAEVNRSPFDLPEAESELVAGFHTEYTGLKFGFFFLAEYANMFIAAVVMTVLFFGGWKAPFGFEIPFVGEFLSGFIWFMVKVLFWLCVFVWFRGTFPRFRIDQMMDFAWKVLVPLALLNVIFTAYLRFSDFDFKIWTENNWRIWEQYVVPLFSHVYTSYYALPAIIIVSIMLLTDVYGAWQDAKKMRGK